MAGVSMKHSLFRKQADSVTLKSLTTPSTMINTIILEGGREGRGQVGCQSEKKHR